MHPIRFCCTSFFSGRLLRPLLLGGLLAATVPGVAQAVASPNDTSAGAIAKPADAMEVAEVQPLSVVLPEGAATSSEALPDAPQPQTKQQELGDKPLVAAVPKTVPVTTNMPVAPLYSKYIPAGFAVQQIHGRQKLILGARDLYSVGNFGDMIASAAWEQIFNGQPNYGTDRGAFGERLGAAAIRETSQGILTDGVFSVMLHQDPRYFTLGPQFGIVHRTLYAITRPLITRSSNDGHSMPNYSLLLGLAAGTALNNLYYPKSNRNLHDNLSSFGGSVGGAALGFALDEFTSDMWKALHLRGRER